VDLSEYYPKESQPERRTRVSLQLAGLSPAEVERLSPTEIELLSQIAGTHGKEQRKRRPCWLTNGTSWTRP
jgi:hypothetical protein